MTEEPVPAAEKQPQPQPAGAAHRAGPSAPANPFGIISTNLKMNLLNNPSIKETIKQIAEDPAFMEMSEEFAKDPSFTEMAELISMDPEFMEMAENIAKDPAFADMADQLQKKLAYLRQRQQQAPAAAAVAQLDPQKYAATVQRLRQNPVFVATADRLGSALMQHPAAAASTMLGGVTNPAQKEQLEARVARMKADPRVKPILDEIESGGPAAMMKYLNDPEALMQNLGRAMGVGGGTEDNDDESIVHTASA